jgi:hypothetical protein
LIGAFALAAIPIFHKVFPFFLIAA